ncbi:MAG: transcription termination/antitermination protein NusA, partial [Candidatus Portnoybacteria bacterium CG10_big_fil_rev_8_21_14_0_10_44_7]
IANVASDQLSLAIGKGGQNVRLAARLTGWKIDVKESKTTNKEQGTSDKRTTDNGDDNETKETKKLETADNRDKKEKKTKNKEDKKSEDKNK